MLLDLLAWCLSSQIVTSSLADCCVQLASASPFGRLRRAWCLHSVPTPFRSGLIYTSERAAHTCSPFVFIAVSSHVCSCVVRAVIHQVAALPHCCSCLLRRIWYMLQVQRRKPMGGDRAPVKLEAVFNTTCTKVTIVRWSPTLSKRSCKRFGNENGRQESPTVQEFTKPAHLHTTLLRVLQDCCCCARNVTPGSVFVCLLRPQ